MPSERPDAPCTRLAGCEHAHAPDRLALELRNDGDWPVECTVEVLAADGEHGDPAPAAGTVRDRWTWTYWLDAGDDRREPGPADHADPAFVRVETDDGRVAGAWATPEDVVQITVTDTALAAHVDE